MTKNGMNIAEKSMEKTRFYNREDLKAKDVARLISIWEGEAGESFTDYCNFSREADKNFLLFLAEKYPILYDYHCKVAGNDWLDHCIIMDFMGKSLLCAWRNNNTCKVGMPFLCRRIIKKGKSGFMYKNKFYSLETKYGWVF